MASAFDGMGLGMMGSEKRFMTGSPISELTRMIPSALLGYGLYKSGAIESLDDMFDPKKALQNKIKGAFTPTGQMGVAINDGNKGYQPSQNLWEAPPETAAEPVAPPQNAAALLPVAPDVSVPAAMPEKSIDDHVNDVIPRQTSSLPMNSPVTENTFMASPTASDTSTLQIASMPAPPPGNINLPQYGKKQDGGGGLQALASLAKLFLG